MASVLLDFAFPSWWELEVTLSAALFLVAVCFAFENRSSPSSDGSKSKGVWFRRRVSERAPCGEIVSCDPENTNEISQTREESETTAIYTIKLELLAAKNLPRGNVNGTTDPYAVITCCQQKRFSSMIPNSRNPLWGEEFNFFVDELPTQISITLYDWDIIRKSRVIGSLIIPIKGEGQSGAVWYTLEGIVGEVCIHFSSYKLPTKFSRSLSNFLVADARRRISQVYYKPGPLQAIFNLPQDEVVCHSYSCALERSFLYHGRIYISSWHLCFHSNIFSKQLKVVIPFGDIYEVKRSHHACINPAITIVLQKGSGGHGVPPLASPDGRSRYKFTSFWNRNQTLRVLQLATKVYRAFLEAEKQRIQLTEDVQSNHTEDTIRQTSDIEINETSTRRLQVFVNEEVLTSAVKDTFPCTAELFFILLLSDNSSFLREFQLARKDTNLNLGQWHAVDDYDGQTREVTFRSLCHSPLCPPDTAVTEWQHYVLSSDKKTLVFETVQQAHDVPFGSYFEIHSRWIIATISKSSSSVDVRIGVNFKKWCILHSKIKSGATEEYKKEVEKMLEAAHVYLRISNYDSNEIEEASDI